MLNHLHLRHTVVFTKTRPWSTICTCESMNDNQLYAESDLHLVYLGHDVYIKMKEKPMVHVTTSASVSTSVVLPKSTTTTPILPEPKPAPCAALQNEGTLKKDKKANQSTPASPKVQSDPLNATSVSVPATDTTHLDQFPGTSSILPPLKPVVLPLKLLIIEQLRSCTSPLVNPFTGIHDTSPVTLDDASHSTSSKSSETSAYTTNSPVKSVNMMQTSPKHNTDSVVKSGNVSEFNLENILKSSAASRS